MANSKIVTVSIVDGKAQMDLSEEELATQLSQVRRNEDAIENKVDKETGKGLSTEDFTTTEKTKLNSVVEGAVKLDEDSFFISEITEEDLTLKLQYKNTDGVQEVEVGLQAADYGVAGLMTPQDKEDIYSLKSEVSQLSLEAVKITAQSLTDAQKQQARENIDASSQSDISKINNDIQSLNSVDDALLHPQTPSALPELCGQPMILFGNGTPQESIVPINWHQYDMNTDTGYNWNGLPSALGQQYINTAGGTAGRYIAVKDGEYKLKWQNC